jgi:hypothetical protein
MSKIFKALSPFALLGSLLGGGAKVPALLPTPQPTVEADPDNVNAKEMRRRMTAQQLATQGRAGTIDVGNTVASVQPIGR